MRLGISCDSSTDDSHGMSSHIFSKNTNKKMKMSSAVFTSACSEAETNICNGIYSHLKNVKLKKCLRTCVKCAYSDFPGYAQSIISALCSPFIYSVVSNDSVSGQRRPLSTGLCGYAGWSASSLSAFPQRHVFAWLDPSNVSALWVLVLQRHIDSCYVVNCFPF